MTDRPFTLIVCSGCTPAGEDPVLDRLRGTVRRCPHGMLVVAPCMIGPLTCAARHHAPGALVLLQPCTADRTPRGRARVVGPLSDRRDAREFCAWVEDGRWDLAALSPRLRLDDVRRAASLN